MHSTLFFMPISMYSITRFTNFQNLNFEISLIAPRNFVYHRHRTVDIYNRKNIYIYTYLYTYIHI